jgi:tyrosyl-tRNA synthetase
VTDPPSGPQGIFGKIMKLPDELLENYYTLLTDLPAGEFKPKIAVHPRDAKAALAKMIITWLHDKQSAAAAEAEFAKTTHGGVPDQMLELPLGAPIKSLAQLLVDAKVVSSKSEAFRKIEEGAVRINGEKKTNRHLGVTFLPNPPASAPGSEFVVFTDSFIVQLGNRKFVRITNG